MSYFMRKLEEKLIGRTEKIHRIWWDFAEYMKQWYEDDDGNFDPEQLMGYEASERVYEYIKTHPEIIVVPCDDSHFMSSDIVLVPHPDMGITAIYIPQCCCSINKLFLYPGHANALVSAINKLTENYLK